MKEQYFSNMSDALGAEEPASSVNQYMTDKPLESFGMKSSMKLALYAGLAYLAYRIYNGVKPAQDEVKKSKSDEKAARKEKALREQGYYTQEDKMKVINEHLGTGKSFLPRTQAMRAANKKKAEARRLARKLAKARSR